MIQKWTLTIAITKEKYEKYMYCKIQVPVTLNLRSSDECHKFIGERLNNINENLIVVEFTNESGEILDYSGFLDAAVVGCTDTRWQDCAKVSKYSPVPGKATIISGPNMGEVISI